MKIHTSQQSSRILTGLIAASASFVLAATGSAQSNPLSAFPMTVDGHFDGLGNGEWSDVTPAHFFSQPGQPAIPVPVGGNSALYAALGTSGGGAGGGEPTLHLLYDFLPRTPLGGPLGINGEIFATIKFPMHIPIEFRDRAVADEQDVTVIFQGFNPAAPVGAGAVGGSFFDIFVDLDFDGSGDVLASQLGLVGAADFGTSPLSSQLHLIVELGVGLRIPANFGTPGGPFPGGGINPATGLYDPDPAFWGAAGGGDGGAAGFAGGAAGENLQSASNALFVINPDGSTSVAPVLVPEPTSAALLLTGLGAFAARRRRQSVA